MPADLLTQAPLVSGSLLAALTTGITPASASVTSGTGYDLGAGGALPAGTAIPIVCRIIVVSASESSGGGTVDFTIDHSSDNSTWKTLAGSSRGANDTITLSASVQTAEVFIGFYTHQRYIRLTVTVGTTPVGANLQFNAQLMPSYP